MSRRKLLQVSILWGEPPLPFKYRFFVRPLRGRGERENQGTPLKPRQGPCPWTPLPKNLYLKGEAPSPPQGTHKGCPYNGTNRLGRCIRTIVGASLVGALGGGGGGTPQRMETRFCSMSKGIAPLEGERSCPLLSCTGLDGLAL